mmetsp:Transcript_2517/g.3427  ORF Transcript_2517/g.3427 Transcript_2517/m.3427 type:complete len:382 (-) Transcript_2517:542-1687(-)
MRPFFCLCCLCQSFSFFASCLLTTALLRIVVRRQLLSILAVFDVLRFIIFFTILAIFVIAITERLWHGVLIIRNFIGRFLWYPNNFFVRGFVFFNNIITIRSGSSDPQHAIHGRFKDRFSLTRLQSICFRIRIGEVMQRGRNEGLHKHRLLHRLSILLIFLILIVVIIAVVTGSGGIKRVSQQSEVLQTWLQFPHSTSIKQELEITLHGFFGHFRSTAVTVAVVDHIVGTYTTKCSNVSGSRRSVFGIIEQFVDHEMKQFRLRKNISNSSFREEFRDVTHILPQKLARKRMPVLHRLTNIDNNRSFFVPKDVILTEISVHKVTNVIHSPHIYAQNAIAFFQLIHSKQCFFQTRSTPTVFAEEVHDENMLLEKVRNRTSNAG